MKHFVSALMSQDHHSRSFRETSVRRFVHELQHEKPYADKRSYIDGPCFGLCPTVPILSVAIVTHFRNFSPAGWSNFHMKVFATILILCVFCIAATQPLRKVENNLLLSDRLPAIRIQVEADFKYLGSFPFRIEDMAEGERFVFVDADGKKLRRLFIAQFESILPESSEIYRYSFDNAMNMGGHRFRHNTFAYSVNESRKEAPGKEADLTARFLDQKGFESVDEWMASRFLTLGDSSRKQELILFYMEPVGPTGHTIQDFYNGEEETDSWRKLSPQLKTRSLQAFKIVP